MAISKMLCGGFLHYLLLLVQVFISIVDHKSEDMLIAERWKMETREKEN